jgi:hypothetical protein
MTGMEPKRLSANHKAMTRRTSLSFPAPIAMGDWLAIGRELFVINDASAWWLGDWLIYGQNRYPDRYKRAVEGTSLQYKTLRNYAWVARKFEPGRRRGGLSFQHHAEVAGLPFEEQDLWLSRAEQHGWSVAALRRRLREDRAIGSDGPANARETLGFELHPERRRRWQEAAERAGSTLDEWISTVLDQETGSVLEVAPAVQRVPLVAPRERPPA